MIPWFPVEAGHIMQFARAVGDTNPAYREGDVLAPPTFVEAGQHFDPDFPYHPQPGRPWFGSAREASSGPPPMETGDGTAMHAETHLTYHRPLRPGDILHSAESEGRTWTRTGRRGGKLTFFEGIDDFLGQDGECRVSRRTVGVRTEHVVEQRRPEAPGAPTGTIPVEGPGAVVPEPGRTYSCLVVDNLPRAQIMQYGGASGDLSPQHTDEVYAREVGGYPTVFAHGMLTMGATGRLVTDLVGIAPLRQYGMRFQAQVWPGDSLLAVASCEDSEDGLRLSLRTLNQRGEVVATGYAVALAR